MSKEILSGTLVTDGDGVDTDTKGVLLVGTTDISGTARAVRVTNDGTLKVDVAALAQESGGNLDAIAASIAAVQSGQLPNDHDVNVTNTSLPLPTGAATETTLSSLNSKVTACNTGAIVGTVTANLGTIGGAATASNQSTIIGHVDGIETLLTTIEVNQLPDGHNVTIDNPGDIGGGVQYTEGDVDASITGTAIMWEDAGNTLRSISASNPFPVNIVAGSSSGVQYTDGDLTVASPVGTIPVFDDGGTIIAVSTANPLPVTGGGGGVQYTDGAVAPANPIGTIPVFVDGSGDIAAVSTTDPLPITGTVTANIGTIAGIATEVTLAAINAKLVSGTDIGDVTVNNAAGGAAVNIQDGGNSITVDGAVTVSGTVAATQSGTWNINNVSGTVSLPTGAATAANQTTGNATLANIQTAVQIMDDWDESDRAKVNPIVGQAGVQGASGVVTANTQRVVLATDVALPTGSNTIGTVNIGTVGGIATETTLSAINTKTPVLGQTTMAGSVPITIASDQSSVPVTPALAAQSSPAQGKVLGTALTGSYVNILTAANANNAKIISAFNSCNNTIVLSLDAGTTDHFELERGESFTLDLGANGLQQASFTIRVKHAGAAPTAGSIRVTVIK